MKRVLKRVVSVEVCSSGVAPSSKEDDESAPQPIVKQAELEEA